MARGGLITTRTWKAESVMFVLADWRIGGLEMLESCNWGGPSSGGRRARVRMHGRTRDPHTVNNHSGVVQDTRGNCPFQHRGYIYRKPCAVNT